MGRKRASEHDAAAALAETYTLLWERRFGQRYPGVVPAGVKNALADLVNRIGYRNVDDLLRRFAADDDEWVVEHGLPLQYFVKHAARYVGRRLAPAGQIKRGFGAAEANRRERERKRR